MAACQINKVECDQNCEENWMDGSQVNDSDGLSGKYLVSRRFPAPDSATLAKPVIVAVHGFTASTYEWMEFQRWAEDPDTTKGGGRIMVSPVLLGGHGRDDADFQGSTWQDWGAPMLAEYDSLTARGYRNISFAGASTGATLMMRYISENAFQARPKPKWFFFVDPIVVPSSKILSLVNIVGPILGNSPDPGTPEENRNWYVNRPAEDLAELYELINLIKNRLEDGFRLPPGTLAKVYKAKKDGSADPVSALYIYKGLRTANGGHIEVEMVNSNKHVFTRLQGRKPGTVGLADTLLQQRVFGEMRDKVLH